MGGNQRVELRPLARGEPPTDEAALRAGPEQARRRFGCAV